MLEPITKRICATVRCRISVEQDGNFIVRTYQAAQTITPERPDNGKGPHWLTESCGVCGSPLTYRLYSAKGTRLRRTLWVALAFAAFATTVLYGTYMSSIWDRPADETSDFIIGGFVATVIACIIVLYTQFQFLRREQGAPGGRIFSLGNGDHYLAFDHDAVKGQPRPRSHVDE